jgi:D-glycero-alpha-D-manno-heptose 1-phosphate guanylyltransferase
VKRCGAVASRLVVLAGGFGTRLSQILGDVPKVLAPIGKQPFLRLQLENWISQGVTEITFLLHYRAEAVINFLERERDGLLDGCEVSWLTEGTPMGTGGAVANAVRLLDIQGDFLLINADTWLGKGIRELSAEREPTVATVMIRDSSRFGSLSFDENLRVTEFREKGGHKTSAWINAGLVRLDSSIFAGWEGDHFSLERQLLPQLARAGSLKALPITTDFIDIGVPADYQRLCDWVATGRLKRLCS